MPLSPSLSAGGHSLREKRWQDEGKGRTRGPDAVCAGSHPRDPGQVPPPPSPQDGNWKNEEVEAHGLRGPLSLEIL